MSLDNHQTDSKIKGLGGSSIFKDKGIVRNREFLQKSKYSKDDD